MGETPTGMVTTPCCQTESSSFIDVRGNSDQNLKLGVHCNRNLKLNLVWNINIPLAGLT